MKVYLAGHITDLTFDGANGWREEVIPQLRAHGIIPLNPLRSKEFLRDYGQLKQNYHNASPLSTGKGIVTRDRNDVETCDVVLMNLKGAKHVSIGCMVEVGWADAHRKPLIVVVDEETPYDHEFIKEIAGYIVTDLDEAIEIVYAIAGVEPNAHTYTPLSRTRLEPLVSTDMKIDVGPYDC